MKHFFLCKPLFVLAYVFFPKKGIVYLYALKKLFTTKYELISEEDLARILLKDES